MVTCLLALCFIQTPSAIVGRTDFTFIDTVAHEELRVEWISPAQTKNIEKTAAGEECWIYDGETITNC